MATEWLQTEYSAEPEAGFQRTGSLGEDVRRFLTQYGNTHTATHCAAVAAEGARIALLCGEDAGLAEQAGWLHDISAVIPNDMRIATARAWGVDVLPQEDAFPMIIHQKLSAIMARSIFGVTHGAVLNAIGCHTTLKANPSDLDKVVFLADKIKWDQPGVPPYEDEMQTALSLSIDEAVLCYLRYLWARRQTLRVVHPWFVDAYRQFSF